MPAKIVYYLLLAAAALVSGCGFESQSAVQHAIGGPASATPETVAPAVQPAVQHMVSPMIPVEPASPREDEIVDLSLG